jgi:hypothetical protein
LGLRSLYLHAPAAYVASVANTHADCQRLLPSLSSPLESFGSLAGRALEKLQASLLSADRLSLPVPSTVQQRELSSALDRATLRRLVDDAASLSHKAHLQLVQQPGAGAWLQAPPSPALGLHVEPRLYRVMLQQRLRLPVLDTEAPCALCDGIADVYGDHARSCACGGDRVKRHNLLRNALAARLSSAGFSPELERPGLLPADPESVTTSSASGRRPADIWVPSWNLHGGVALDLAVTSGLRVDVLPTTAADGGHPAVSYEGRKCRHANTEQACKAAGFAFLPVVAEACGGGWGPVALSVFRRAAAGRAASSGESVDCESGRLLEALSIILHRENARAVLRRLPQ